MAPSSTIPANIQMMVHHFYGIGLEEVPSIDFVQQSHIMIHNIAETLAAYKLGKTVSYSQTFFDKTTRRQIPFTSFSIGYEDNIGDVSPCIFCKDNTSTTQIDGIVEKFNSLKHCLSRWAEMHKGGYPESRS
eukprot:3643917-Ditylum_brightwellii.AAC.1